MSFGRKVSEVGPEGFPAIYDGWCVGCEKDIYAGQLIAYSNFDSAFVHFECLT